MSLTWNGQRRPRLVAGALLVRGRMANMTAVLCKNDPGVLVVWRHPRGEVAEIGVRIAGEWHGLHLTVGAPGDRVQQALRRYDHGALIETRYFDWDGRACTSDGTPLPGLPRIVRYRDGSRDGLHVRHHETGEVAEMAFVVDGELDGLSLHLASGRTKDRARQTLATYGFGTLLSTHHFAWSGQECAADGDEIEEMPDTLPAPPVSGIRPRAESAVLIRVAV